MGRSSYWARRRTGAPSAPMNRHARVAYFLCSLALGCGDQAAAPGAAPVPAPAPAPAPAGPASPAQPPAEATTDAAIFVAPDGLDGNPGTMAQPTTLHRAVTLVPGGGTVYLRGGTYRYTATVLIAVGNDGTAQSPKRVFAYRDEKPVLDFSAQTYVRNRANARGIEVKGDYWHLRGLEVQNAADNGIFVSGSHDVVELCVAHHNRDSGFQLGRHDETTPREKWPSYDRIVNCDSYQNFDPPDGGDADGFAPKIFVGAGNEFRGCRAWNNSDDGWDLFTKPDSGPIGAVLIDGCMAFDNGYASGGYPMTTAVKTMGNGNGFKLGGSHIGVDHVVTRSISFGNKVRGFDENNNTGAMTLKNDTAWLNGAMNFAFEDGKHLLVNNLSHVQRAEDETSGTSVTNSWQGTVVKDADFVSLDRTLARAPRQPDGSLPATDLLRLAPGSRFIDAGTAARGPELPFLGVAPDLGARETR
jgi:hypothetical protein